MWYGSQGSGRKLKRGKFHLNVRKKPFRPEGGQALEEPPERWWGLHQGRCSNPAGHGPAQPARGIVLGLGAGAEDPRALRQPRLSADPGAVLLAHTPPFLCAAGVTDCISPSWFWNYSSKQLF